MRVCQAGSGPGQHECDIERRWESMQEEMRTSVRAPPFVLAAAAPAPERLGPARLGSGFETLPRPRRLSSGLGFLFRSHCALIRSKSWVSSIPVPSSSSPPTAATVAVANKASQEAARCSCRARAACKQPTRGNTRGREEERGK